MGASYDLWLLHHADGHTLTHIANYTSLQYAKVVNDVGAWTLVLPASFDTSLVQRDTRLAVYRNPPGGTKALDFVGLTRYISKDVKGKSLAYTLQGPDLNDFLKRRIIAYVAGSTQASKTMAADDMMKEIIDENMGASAPVSRDITPYGFSIEADTSLGMAFETSFAWEPLLDTLKKISDTSCYIPTESVYFGIVPLNTGWECQFRTNIQQWGQDHRHPSGAAVPVIFSLSFRNLENVTRNVNYRDEVTYCYAGGQGDGALRNIQTIEDTPRSGASPFNRCETFFNASNATTDAAVMAEAAASVRAGRPRRLFSANLTHVGSRVYGRDYGHGDYVTCVFDGETLDARIDAVSVNVSGNNEDVQMLVREETSE